jgi:lipoprotein-anchoring transpeptidase ErfK/SrfK
MVTVIVRNVTNAARGWVRGHRRAAAVALAAAGATACAVWLALDGPDSRAARPLPPPRTATGYFTPESGSTVGTGMIVSVVFDHPVTRRAAVSRAVRVLTTPSVPVAGHWFGDRRLDLRPRRFWAPGTLVDLRLRLNGVRTAPGRYGTQSKDIVFRVGRDQRDEIDAARHTLTVLRDGRPLRVLPISAGDAAHATYDGTMVIAQKSAKTRMNSATVGFGGEYDIPDVPHAMRLTDSGTFLHGNYWSPRGVFGAANTSHGCVGLPDARGGAADSPAGWLYDRSLVGDPVTVVHSAGAHVAPGNGLGGWNMPWSRWTAGES